jgi:hypothetical protein
MLKATATVKATAMATLTSRGDIRVDFGEGAVIGPLGEILETGREEKRDVIILARRNMCHRVVSRLLPIRVEVPTRTLLKWRAGRIPMQPNARWVWLINRVLENLQILSVGRVDSVMNQPPSFQQKAGRRT